MKKGKNDEKYDKSSFPKLLYVVAEDDGDGAVFFTAAVELSDFELDDNDAVAIYRLEKVGRARVKTEIV